LAISVIRSGIGGQGKNADKHFAAVNPESQARRTPFPRPQLPGVERRKCRPIEKWWAGPGLTRTTDLTLISCH